jgi:hypothetical protein
VNSSRKSTPWCREVRKRTWTQRELVGGIRGQWSLGTQISLLEPEGAGYPCEEVGSLVELLIDLEEEG